MIGVGSDIRDAPADFRTPFDQRHGQFAGGIAEQMAGEQHAAGAPANNEHMAPTISRLKVWCHASAPMADVRASSPGVNVRYFKLLTLHLIPIPQRQNNLFLNFAEPRISIDSNSRLRAYSRLHEIFMPRI